MPRRYNVTEIHRLNRRRIFFDTNILIYLFWPTQSYWEAKYSAIFQRLLSQENDLVVDFYVISELINRVLRIEYAKNIPENSPVKFKSFRENPDGQSAIDDIYQIVKNKIITRFCIFGKSFNKSEIEGFLKNDGLDFNDKALAAICKENNFVLLTNDKDFSAVDLDILTSNPDLLIAR